MNVPPVPPPIAWSLVPSAFSSAPLDSPARPRDDGRIMDEYRVALDIYNGPLDLLLYLIRRDEVDIYDIPISRILEQYLHYVEVIHSLDPNVAGEFLVLAATLMEVKTRMLLPVQASEEGEEVPADDLDPRSELVRQLLQYKAFKDAAHELGSAAEIHALRFPRRPDTPDLSEPALELEDVQIWDLVDAFQNVLNSIGQQVRNHEVIYDDTPIELHQTDILDRLDREGPLTFRRIFEGRTGRSEVIGLFLAMLELVRQKRILATQDQSFGEIHIHVNPNPPDFLHEEEEPETAEGEAIEGEAAENEATENEAAENEAAEDEAAGNETAKPLSPGGEVPERSEGGEGALPERKSPDRPTGQTAPRGHGPL